MGYRELLKKFMHFVEVHTGDHFVDVISYVAEPRFSVREIGQLKALADELDRDADGAVIDFARLPSFNYRLRLLCICYGLTPMQAAELGGVDEYTFRRWRTNPKSKNYVAMREPDFQRFEQALFEWRANQDDVTVAGAALLQGLV